MRISDWSSDVCSSDLTGDSNSATVNQDTSTFAVQSTSYIEQSGDSNTADVTQVDDWQSSSVVQSSDGNSATVSQGDATAALTDDSYGNTSTINQAGSGGPVAECTQYGLVNTSYVAQTGYAGEAYCTQRGIGNGTSVPQRGPKQD